jgi:hypothetical protein
VRDSNLYAKVVNSAWNFNSLVDPNKHYSGSYVLNGWFYSGLPDPDSLFFRNFAAVPKPATTPLSCDSIWADVWPDAKSGPAIDLLRGAVTPDFGRITIARHGIAPGNVPRYLSGNALLVGAINVSYADGPDGVLERRRMETSFLKSGSASFARIKLTATDT